MMANKLSNLASSNFKQTKYMREEYFTPRIKKTISMKNHLFFLIILLSLECKSQSYFNELFTLDTTITLKTKDFATVGVYGAATASYENFIIFTDHTRAMKSNDSIPFLKYDIENKKLSSFFLITNNHEFFSSKYTTIRNIALNENNIFVSLFKHIVVFKKTNDNYLVDDILQNNNDEISVINDSTIFGLHQRNPTSSYLLYNFINREYIEQKTFNIDILGMVHIAPSKYLDAQKDQVFFTNANKYEVVRYNYLTKTTDTVIKHMPKKWNYFSEKEIRTINKIRPGAPVIKALQNILPSKNVIHGLAIINDTTLFIRHIQGYYGQNLELFVDIWKLQNNEWILSASNIKYSDPVEPNSIISKNNYPIFLYNSFNYNKQGLFYTISDKETELSPIGMTYTEFYEKNQNELISKEPVYKLNIFYKK